MDQVTFASVMREAGQAKFMLAKDLLAEVPVQVVEYMRENNVQPNPGTRGKAIITECSKGQHIFPRAKKTSKINVHYLLIECWRISYPPTSKLFLGLEALKTHHNHLKC